MIAALIIATGKTTRKDSFELQKEVGTIPTIQRIAKVFQCAGIARVIAICDEDRNQAEQLLARMNVVFLHNHANAEMLDSAKLGLAYLQDKCSAAIIVHVDVPLFSVETVRTLMASTGQICVPSFKGNAGHPILLRAEHFQAVLSYSGDGGLSGAVKASGLERHLVEVDDEGVLINVHYGNDYERLIAGHSLSALQPEIRIRLVKEKPFYGPGAHQLLQLTVETNSLLEACQLMGMSYSKGRGIISLIEQQSGYSVIESQQGGKNGGCSRVTEEGKALMQNYTEFCAAAKQNLRELFGKYFGR